MPDPNPNRSLPPEEVEALVATRLPHLVTGLGRDRTWVWFAGDKPSETDRSTLKELGFSFTPRAHELPDGRQALWFHPAGGRVLRRGKHGKPGPVSSRQHSSSRSSAESNDVMADISRLADLLPS